MAPRRREPDRRANRAAASDLRPSAQQARVEDPVAASRRGRTQTRAETQRAGALLPGRRVRTRRAQRRHQGRAHGDHEGAKGAGGGRWRRRIRPRASHLRGGTSRAPGAPRVQQRPRRHARHARHGIQTQTRRHGTLRNDHGRRILGVKATPALGRGGQSWREPTHGYRQRGDRGDPGPARGRRRQGHRDAHAREDAPHLCRAAPGETRFPGQRPHGQNHRARVLDAVS